MSVNCLIFAGNSGTFDFKTKSAGPYRIATELRQNGFTVQVVDLSGIKKFTKLHEKILEKFVGTNTLWIAFSTNFLDHIIGYPWTHSKKELEYLRKYENNNLEFELLKFIKYAKKINPKLLFLTGGIKIFDVDHLNFIQFRGHTDQEIVDFTKNINATKKIIFNKEYSNFVNSQIRYTKQDILFDDKALPIEISRGCIFKCKFCSFPLNGKKKGEWIKKYDVLYDELVYNYENFGVQHYIFADDTYNDSPSKVEELYENVYSKLPFKLSFTTYLRLDLLMRYPHTAEILKESGLKSAVFGIETLNPQGAKIIGKGVDPMKQIEFLQKIKTDVFSNINLSSGWILGIPTDTKESLIKFVKWFLSDDNPIDFGIFNSLVIRPVDHMEFRLYRSEFDLTFDQYDYEFYDDKKWKPQWKSKTTGLTSEFCEQLVNILYTYSLKRKTSRMGNFKYSDYVNIGVPEADLISKNISELYAKYDIKKMCDEIQNKYLINLLSL